MTNRLGTAPVDWSPRPEWKKQLSAYGIIWLDGQLFLHKGA